MVKRVLHQTAGNVGCGDERARHLRRYRPDILWATRIILSPLPLVFCYWR